MTDTADRAEEAARARTQDQANHIRWGAAVIKSLDQPLNWLVHDNADGIWDGEVIHLIAVVRGLAMSIEALAEGISDDHSPDVPF